MKCPKCQFENPEGIQFCGKCGTKFEKICPQCNFSNPPEFEFCGKCGHDLTVPSEQPPRDLSFDEKLEKVQRYLPRGLTEKILAQRDKIEGERKQVTVMFCDMKGFTPLSEKFGHEKIYSIMDEVFEILIHKVLDYGGTINKMTGDGIMALFGAPRALEHAPQRAIRSALAIQREMTRFSNRLKSESRIPPIKMRIGINTGPVVVGSLGNDLRLEFTAVGDTVNLASRMEGLAEPGTTYVTEETFKVTEGLFLFETLGEKQVKGKKAPIKAYRVITTSTRRTRFDVSAEWGLTPFVGRERELELLLDGFERATTGRGQAFSIMGEAGVGKSRLLYEFRKAIANEDATFLEGRCLSYSRGVAYHPVVDLLKSNFDISESEEDYLVRDKVKKGLKLLGVDEANTLPYLLELLSVKDSGIANISMSPEARKDRILEAVKRIILKGAEIQPLIMAIEDLHWTDRSTEDTLKYWLDAISGAPVFLIFTYRPEFVHTWGGRSYHSQVTLNRFSNRESLAMVAHLLGTEEIAVDLEELILQKTEGIPFFIEEFMKSLKDLEIIERKDSGYFLTRDVHDVTIPGTIQDVIMARVDSLPEAARGVLKTGSAIEREFSYELMKRVTGISEQELLSRLSALRDAELLYERGIYPQSTYIFKHALTREVVYDSIMTKKRKKLHLDIGDAIEQIHKDNLDEHYALLAEHYIEGESYEKGAEYCRLAGRKAERAASLNDAIAYSEKRIACLERLPQVEDVQRKIVDARTAVGLYHIEMNRHFEAKEAVDPIVDLALELGYKRRVSQIYTIMGSYWYFLEDDFPKAFKYLEDALKIAEELNDTLSLAQANYWLGHALCVCCKFERGLRHMEKVLEINVMAELPWGVSLEKSMLSTFAYNYQGMINLGYRTSDEALRLAEESGDIYSKGYAYASHGFSCYCKGFLEEATEHLLKGIDFSERMNQFAWAFLGHVWLLDTCVDMGEYERSKNWREKASAMTAQHGFSHSGLNMIEISLAWAKVMNNETDVDLEALYRYGAEDKWRVYDGWTSRHIGEILLNIDEKHMSEAEDWISKAIEADSRNGMMFYLGKDHAAYAELLKRKGDLSTAEEKLNTAIKIFKKCGADGWVVKAEKELKGLSRKK
jgi:class 3 adenylate cyclase/tetratricopeptide (TPR) repeat protein/ribosomal protein L40E